MDEQTRQLIKKYESNIILSGRSMLFFGLWDAFKFLATYLYGEGGELNEDLNVLIQAELLPDYAEWIIVGIVCLILFSFNFYIGAKAIAYGKGRGKRRVWFLVVAGIFGLATLAGIPYYFSDIKITDLDSVIATALMDVAFVYMVFDMIYSAGRLAAINKKRLKEA